MAIALVTGASRGIGRACALSLARDGFEVWANYRSSEEQAQSLAREIEGMGGTCRLLRFDVADRAAAAEALAALEDQPLEVLVNNAGMTRDSLFMTMKDEDWDDVIDVNLRSFFTVTRPCLKVMSRLRKGRIITIASVSGQSGNRGQANYAASKGGVIAATKSLAQEYGRWNVLANVIAPGFIDTEMLEGLPRAEIEKRIPLRRFGTPEEVAAIVSFLASEGASYVTGAVINVNGGIYC